MTDPREAMDAEQFGTLTGAFGAQLRACLEECAQGRRGLFSNAVSQGEDGQRRAWPEAERLRELALAIQGILAQTGERDALCDEFLDLCSMHGESDPGERRLARGFLQRIDGGQVGSATLEKRKP
jgi:hypothetical protein